jgi:hypothetical protein
VYMCGELKKSFEETFLVIKFRYFFHKPICTKTAWLMHSYII